MQRGEHVAAIVGVSNAPHLGEFFASYMQLLVARK
jgi:hypothetical protein